jgi:UDPglucose--hexose-1-phosphate uridylyltransferase
VIEQELTLKERMLIETPGFVAFMPYAGRFPFETWILPRRHESHFEEIDDSEGHALATMLKRTLVTLESALDRPPYNYLVHTAPFRSPPLAHYHWHIEILPRLTEIAGFELGTGCYINPVPPEQAADFLRMCGGGFGNK